MQDGLDLKLILCNGFSFSPGDLSRVHCVCVLRCENGWLRTLSCIEEMLCLFKLALT